jgi:hydroxyacyl-ACP dehydratase HTD2-like protein with hotdog domain
MRRLPPELIGRDVDLGRKQVVPDDIRRYARLVGDDELADGICTVAPLGFALALRGGPVPEVQLTERTISVHGSHTIAVVEPLAAPDAYHVQSRITDVFEKSGRSGPLTVIVRRAEIRDDSGAQRVVVEDQQIVRWQRAAPAVPARRSGSPVRTDRPPSVGRVAVGIPDIGTVLGPEERTAPAAVDVEAYGRNLAGGEALFVDRRYAQGLGYEDVIVPGPVQSALLERMLRRSLPAWNLWRLSISFRIPLVASEPIALTATVVEHHLRCDGEWLTCDLWIDNGSGERAAIGTADLRL